MIEEGSFKSYTWGLFLCILLTLAAYFLVKERWLNETPLIFSIVGLALIQALVQLVLFLYLGQESKPHWKMMVFLFMTMVLLILVLGSMWIMYHLNYRQMPPMDVNHAKSLF